MLWENGRRSENVEDRRGIGVDGIAGGGVGVVVIALIAMFFGVDPRVILQETGRMQARGYVAPESLTHGSSAQRVQWFRRGLESGELSACDTFKAGHA
jgi:predicted metalloprotease